MKANRGAGSRNKQRIEVLKGVSRSFKAVPAQQLTAFNKVLGELRAWNWEDPDTSYEDWRAAFILKVGGRMFQLS